MDFATLRQEGIRWLERLSGGQWTDFNEHDPGITILEQLCYVLSDLSYRAGYSVPDLLAEGNADPYASLPPPEEILPSAPVTPEDLQRLVLDVKGVRNAWVEPAQQSGMSLSFLPHTRELRTSLEGSRLAENPTAQHSQLLGLHRIVVETSAPPPGTSASAFNAEVRSAVLRRLERNRALCEDITEVKLLGIQPLYVLATVEVEPLDDPAELGLQICRAIQEEVSPRVGFLSLDAMLAAGVPVDEIFEGPRLDQGFLPAASLVGAGRRSSIHTSDLVHAIMDVKGVRAVSRIAVSSSGDNWQPWSLPVEVDCVARFTLSGSKVFLRRLGRISKVPLPTQDEIEPAASPSKPAPAAKKPAPAVDCDHEPDEESDSDGVTRAAAETAVATGPQRSERGTLTPPAARNRNVSKYTSVQRHMPVLYGVGPQGPPGTASLQRKAQALQLKAYLMFFDQLLANSFAQLAHVNELFSFFPAQRDAAARSPATPPGSARAPDAIRTYFAQVVEGSDRGPDGAFATRDDDLHFERVCCKMLGDAHSLQKLLEPAAGEDSDALKRKNRFLNHLLARFAEPVGEQVQIASLPNRVQRKQQLLQSYPGASRARGTGTNLLEPELREPCSLKSQLELKLGFLSHGCEEVIVVEHILLRAMVEEVEASPEIPSDVLGTLLFAAARSKDAFSMQVTLVVSHGQGPFAQGDHRQLFERAVRAETPAHIVPYIFWLQPADFAEFKRAHAVWQRLLGAYRQLLVKDEVEVTKPTELSRRLRGARDRVIDLLKIGETYPLKDTQVRPKEPQIAFGTRPILRIAPSQVRVCYTLYEGDAPVTPRCSVEGNGEAIDLVGPQMDEDRTFRILAEKLDFPERRLFLFQELTVRVGIRTDLPVTISLRAQPTHLARVEKSDPFLLIDYDAQVVVRIGESQSGVHYELQYRHPQSPAPPTDASEATLVSVLGTGDAIELVTPVLKEDVIVQVRATRYAASSNAAQSELLSTQLSIAVRANPRIAVAASITEFAGMAELSLSGAQSSVQYEAYLHELSDPKFLLDAPPDAKILRARVTEDLSHELFAQVLDPPRTLDSLVPPDYEQAALSQRRSAAVLSCGPITEDCVVVLKAVKDHSAALRVQKDTRPTWPQKSAVLIEQAVLALVRPQPVPGLSLTLQPGPDATTAAMLVEGGQPGVLYRFYRSKDEKSEIGAAYFHRVDAGDPGLNRGIDQLSIDGDFIITREPRAVDGDQTPDPARRQPLPPELYLSAEFTKTPLFVQATKLRTGVIWSERKELSLKPLRSPS